MRTLALLVTAPGRVERAVSAELVAASGLSLTELLALREVHTADRRGLRLGALAEAVDRSPSATSRMVGRLVDAGLLERTHDPDDERAAAVCLTDAGRTRLDEAAHVAIAAVDRLVLAPLDPAQVTALGRALYALAEHEPGGP